MTSVQAEALEARVARAPDDLSIRLQLLGYYQFLHSSDASVTKRHLRHLSWLIHKHPGSRAANVAATCVFGLPSQREAYAKCRALWLQAVEARPHDLAVLRNAVAFVHPSDHDRIMSLLAKAEALEPENPEWRWKSGQALLLQMRDRPEAARGLVARQAAAKFEAAAAMSGPSVPPVLWVDLFHAAALTGNRQKTEAYAKELRRVLKSVRASSEVHRAHILLGRVAAKYGRLDDACAHLLSAGRVSGGREPALATFGPNMMLAEELVVAGRGQAVIQYLDLCGRFWQDGQARLHDWKNTILAGGKPDFGCNRWYGLSGPYP